MNQPPAKPQSDKFKDLAHGLEYDEDEAAFDDAVRNVAPRARHLPRDSELGT